MPAESSGLPANTITGTVLPVNDYRLADDSPHMARDPTNKLIVFTRLPKPGETKTRLIPALGRDGAAAFHDQLARHAIGRASTHAMRNAATGLEIRITGGSPAAGRAWLGKGNWREQGAGDLGERMARASSEAFDTGASKVVIIGSDCPRLDDTTIDSAFDALDRAEVVFGPAADGGYYLAGLSMRCPELFKGIEWGGGEVLARSLENARSLGMNSSLLEMLPDVDLPDDLPDARHALATGTSISVIIPALNEAAHLGRTLDRVMTASPSEVLVADGGSSDSTVAIAKEHGARVFTGVRGRAAQMNLAATAAKGEFLLFLHADTLPPENYPALVTDTLNRPSVAAGAFRFELDGDPPGASLVERFTDIRCRCLHLPYGDQGLFLRRSLFRHLGGFPDWPVMEDLHFVRQLRRVGEVNVTRDPARTSPRRWRNQGLVSAFLRHQLMLAAYFLGIPPRHIAKLRP